MTFLSLLFVLLLPVLSYAHTGHGSPGSFTHDLHHMLWLLAGLVLMLIFWVKVKS